MQYPGVDECCDSDLKQIRMALRLAGVLKIDRQLQDELFNEIQSSLHAELDYVTEAHNLQIFATFHQQIDPQLIIPKVYADYSSRRVLTLSEEAGESIETASTWPVETRNALGNRLFKMMVEQIFYLNSFHCDPHPGNFAFRPDGSVVVYDFGCIKELPLPVVQSYRELVQASRRGDIAQIEQQLRDLRVRTDSGQVPAAFYQQWLTLLLPPINGPFNFADSTLHQQAVAAIKDSLKYWDSFQPSADTMMINRAVSGHYWNMVSLKVIDDFSPQVERLLPTP